MLGTMHQIGIIEYYSVLRLIGTGTHYWFEHTWNMFGLVPNTDLSILLQTWTGLYLESILQMISISCYNEFLLMMITTDSYNESLLMKKMLIVTMSCY